MIKDFNKNGAFQEYIHSYIDHILKGDDMGEEELKALEDGMDQPWHKTSKEERKLMGQIGHLIIEAKGDKGDDSN